MKELYVFIFILITLYFLYLSNKNDKIETFQNSNNTQLINALSKFNLGDCSAKFIIENGIGLLRKIDSIEQNLKENKQAIELIRKKYEGEERKKTVLKNAGIKRGKNILNKQKTMMAKDLGISKSKLNDMINNPRLPTESEIKKRKLMNIRD